MQSFYKKNTKPVKKADISVAKNYLNEDEIKLLGLLVEQYLAFAETMAQQRFSVSTQKHRLLDLDCIFLKELKNDCTVV